MKKLSTSEIMGVVSDLYETDSPFAEHLMKFENKYNVNFTNDDIINVCAGNAILLSFDLENDSPSDVAASIVALYLEDTVTSMKLFDEWCYAVDYMFGNPKELGIWKESDFEIVHEICYLLHSYTKVKKMSLDSIRSILDVRRVLLENEEKDDECLGKVNDCKMTLEKIIARIGDLKWGNLYNKIEL